MDKQQRKSKPKVNKIDKLLARLVKKKREKPKIGDMCNETGYKTTQQKDNKEIIRKRHKQLYAIMVNK